MDVGEACSVRFEHFVLLFFRAVELGLTAEDMVAVQDYTETLRTKHKTEQESESAAAIIKREVQKQETQLRVGYFQSWLQK